MRVKASIGQALRLFNRRDQRLLGLAIVIAMAVSLLDLAGITLLGGVGALALSAISKQAPPDAVSRAVSSLGLSGLSPTATIAILASVATTLLLAKSVISPLLLRRSLGFLARREGIVSARLTKELLSRPLTFVQKRSSQETTLALLYGVNSATTVIGQFIAALSEAWLLIVLAVLLLLTNTAVALGLIAFMAIVGVGLQQALGNRAEAYSTRRRQADVASTVAVHEVVGTYREITVADRRLLYVDQMRSLREEAAASSAGLQFVNSLPKYVAEFAMVFGAVAMAGVLFATEPLAVAAGTFSIFLAAATRILPSVIRLQGSALTIRAAAAQAEPTFLLAEELGHPVGLPEQGEVAQALEKVLRQDYTGFTSSITLHDVSITYPGSRTAALNGVSLDIRAGQSIAFAGRSGAGKSTIVDVMLGVLEPDSGEVTIGGLPPGDAIKRWPGAIGYVPQHVFLSSGSVRANVAMGLPPERVDDELVWDALQRAHLADFVRKLPEGLDSRVGERGFRLSGGQRQRLGLARALFTRPRLIVLDEATSSLDAETELAITETIENLDEGVTRIIIAHRLSTIRHADVVAYLEHGQIIATGTFDEVCDQVPALERQAILMGLREREDDLKSS